MVALPMGTIGARNLLFRSFLGEALRARLCCAAESPFAQLHPMSVNY
jgi:hypothetical protein